MQRPLTRPMPRERIGSRTAKIGTLQHFVWLKYIVFATLILNVLDAVFTMLWIWTGAATEGNPMMAEVVADPGLFVTVKLLLVGSGSVMLWRHRRRRGAVVGIFVVFLTYYFLLLYHLSAVDIRRFTW